MYPPIWGPYVWVTLHLFAYSYPDKPSDERKQQMNDFLLNLSVNLPCPGCGHHCAEYVATNPPKTNNRSELVKWVRDFHNAVNRRTGKRELSYAESERFLMNEVVDIKTLHHLNRNQDKMVEEESRTIRLKHSNDQLMYGLIVSSLLVVVFAVLFFRNQQLLRMSQLRSSVSFKK